METYIAYFDETGDDGANTTSSKHFVLTSLYMPVSSWKSNFDIMAAMRKELREKYGFHTAEEMHTKAFLTDKNPYRMFNWSKEERIGILNIFVDAICKLEAKVITVIIDKEKLYSDDYPVLKNALTYNIQRIENSSAGNWNYIIITDPGRTAPMRKTAREIRAYNPIHSKYGTGYSNNPIKYMVEDIMEKDSKESHFIQICDFISFFTHLYYETEYKKRTLPSRVGALLNSDYVRNVMDKFEENGVLNQKASSNKYGLVIYPK